MTMKLIAILALALALVPWSFASEAATTSRQKSVPAAPAKSATVSSDPRVAQQEKEYEVRSVLMSLEHAFATKSLDTAIALFADNAIFIDQSGEETHGREAIRSRFEPFFQQQSLPSIGMHPGSMRFPAGTVASVVGEVSRKQGASHLPATRFTMLLVQENSKWLISEVTETVIQSAQFEDRLAELDWMIGNWRVTKNDIDAKLNVEWAAGKKFILAKTTVTKPDKSEQIDTQVIGWDPQNKRVISWHFDSNGGYGSGYWTKRPDKDEWSVDVSGIGADGSTTRATNVFQLKSPGEFLWQSVNRSQDDAPVADTEALTVQRLKS